MKKGLRKRWWPILKGFLALGILTAVGWEFYQDLKKLDLEEVPLRPGWLVLSGILYLAGLGFSAGFWYQLLHFFGERPGKGVAFRAYFLGHLGKYVPGKAWALLLRGGLARQGGVRLGVAIISAFYEVLTTMAAGALLAAGIFIFQAPVVPGLEWNPILVGLFLLVLVSVPLLPAVFNLLVGRLAARFQNVASFRLPPLGLLTLAEGMVLTGLGWLFLGASLWALLQGCLPRPPELTLATAAHCLGSLALAYVAGFLAVMVPGGMGVREYFLLNLLANLADKTWLAVAVLLLRLIWTGAEVLAAGVVYWFPFQNSKG